MSEQKGLGRKARRGVAWTLAGSAVSNLLKIAVLAILGRLLLPSEFGVVAAAMTVIFLAQHLRGLGIGMALVQRRELSPAHASTAFAFSLLLGAGLSVLVFLSAPLVASLYHTPAAEPLVRVLSILFLLRGAASTSMHLLQREMRFGAVTLRDVVAYAIGAAVSVAFAFAGAGAWALAAGYLVEAAISCAMLLALYPPPRPRIDRAALSDLFGFGAGHTAAGIANYFATQGDYIVVGRFLDAAALGFYTRAYELIRVPAVLFANVVGNVLLSSFAKLQDDPHRLGEAFRRVLFGNAVLLLPTSAGLIVLAPEVIRILMGPGWEAAVLPFQIMATTMLFRTSYKASAIVARAVGSVYRIAGWQVVYAVVVMGGGVISVRWGIAGVACTTAAAVAVNFFGLTGLALKQVNIGWRQVAAAHMHGLVAAVLAVAAAWPVAVLLRRAEGGAAAVAVAGTVAGGCACLLLAVLAIRRRRPDITWLWQTLRQTLSGGRKKRRQPRDTVPG